jgi:hypothetical protein
MILPTPDVNKEGEHLATRVGMCHYNQHMAGDFEKYMLLQMYLAQRGRMKNLYMKLFRKFLIATVLISLIVCRRNMERKVDHINFRTDFIEGILVKYLCIVKHQATMVVAVL